MRILTKIFIISLLFSNSIVLAMTFNEAMGNNYQTIVYINNYNEARLESYLIILTLTAGIYLLISEFMEFWGEIYNSNVRRLK